MTETVAAVRERERERENRSNKLDFFCYAKRAYILLIKNLKTTKRVECYKTLSKCEMLEMLYDTLSFL